MTVLDSNVKNQSQDGLRLSFVDYVRHGTSLPRLKEGEEYKATLANWSIVEPVDSNQAPYVRLELQLTDRIVVDNRFEVGFRIFENQIKQQLGIEEEVKVSELLDKLKETEFKIWVSYQFIKEKQRTYTNYNFLPPVDTNSETPSKESEELEF